MNDYTPEEWRLIMQNAHDALAQNPNDAEAREALQAAIPMVQRQNTETSAQEMDAAQDPGRLASLGMGFSQGATFGFGDEVAALLNAAGAMLPGGQSPGEAFRSSLDQGRETLQQARQEHPFLTGTGDVIGAGATILPGMAGLGARGGAAVAGQVARVGLPRVGRVVGRAVSGALTGAGYAGASEAGRSEGGVGERAGAAAGALPAGAIIGGTLGVGAPFAGELARSAARKGASMVGLGPQGWVRRGFQRLTGPAEAAAPKATPKPRVRRRGEPKPKAPPAASQIIGPNQPRPGHPIYRSQRAPTRSKEVRGGEPLTPSTVGRGTRTQYPRQYTTDQSIRTGILRHADQVPQEALEHVPTEVLQTQVRAARMMGGREEAIAAAEAELARRGAGGARGPL